MSRHKMTGSDPPSIGILFMRARSFLFPAPTAERAAAFHAAREVGRTRITRSGHADQDLFADPLHDAEADLSFRGPSDVQVVHSDGRLGFVDTHSCVNHG